MKLIIGVLVVLALLAALAVSAVFISYSTVHASQGAQPPAKPTGLSVSTAQGSLDVGVDWDEVDGAAEYWVRWRFVQPDHKLNEGVRVGSSATTITLAEYGEWVVRVQACNDTGCGAPLAKRFAVEPTSEPTPTPEPTPDLQVSIAADATELEVNEEVTLSAVFTNAPADSSPTYRWQLDLGGGSWHSSGTEATFSYLQSNAASTAFRVAVSYGSGASATSDPIIITWVPPNKAPVVDDRSEHYAGFTGAGNAPLGTLVSKIYEGIFSDPDGDTLTYTVSVPADESVRVDTVYIQEEIQRVFIRLDAENDWGAVTPVLADQVVTTVTLTATDPDGLSASVTGEFHTNVGLAGPENLTASAGSGPLNRSVTWDAVVGATYYKVRWRRVRRTFNQNNELIVTTPSANITVADWGQWEVRVEACNSAVCGVGVSETINLAAPQPNILLILSDDLGYGELGPFTTEEKIKTPRLDQMAAQGMIFTSHYAGAPVCAPSRSVLMTGLHTGHTPIRGDKRGPGDKGDWPIEDEVVTLGEVMKDAGYRTALVGKWGLGIQGTTGHPNSQGFDHFFGYLDHGSAWYSFPRVLFRNGDTVNVNHAYADSLFIEEAQRYISEESDKPFFLVVSLTAPHANNSNATMEVPDLGQYADKSEWTLANKRFAAKVTLMDTHVGQILDELSEEGISQNTLTIFTSDNGPHDEGEKSTSFFDGNGQFRDIKRSMYEGGIRVPMIAHWPGTITANSSSAHISAFQDYMPTFAKLGGGTIPTDTGGISMHQTLLATGTQPTHEFLYWEFFGHWGGFKQAVRLGSKWKGVRTFLSSETIELNDLEIELYDLENDIGEMKDVAAQHPDIVEKIVNLMQSARTDSDVFVIK